MEKLITLQDVIGYQFQNKELLKNALTHSSYANERKIGECIDNERLEFLGDAVLELAVSEYLYHEKPSRPEGEMTRTRASLVCEQTLDLCAKKFGLGEYILLGKGEEATGGRKRPSIVSDAMEALIGAIYLDGGFANAKEFVLRFILKDIDQIQLFCDSKTILQEIVQKDSKEKIKYCLVHESGPDHNKTFFVDVVLGERVLGHGKGSSKKNAEQQAAYQAILLLNQTEGDS